MSSRPPVSRARGWRLMALALALALLLVLAVGAWAQWRPLSDDAAARLTARATAESVRTGLHPNQRWIPDEVLARQVAALGPEATPAQQRRLDERGVDVDRPASLDAAADELAHLARETEDPELTSELASVAASWWAGAASDRGAGTLAPTPGNPSPGTSSREARPSFSSADTAPTGRPSEDPSAGPHTRGGGASSPGHGTSATDAEQKEGSAQDTAATPDTPCNGELTAALSAVDRSLFTAEAASARSTPDADSPGDVVAAAARLHRTELTDPRVAAAMRCDPPPVTGFHELPAGFTQDSARATGAVEREARDALVRAAASSSGEQRDWVLDALRTAARAGQVLDPEQPVPAVPGRP